MKRKHDYIEINQFITSSARLKLHVQSNTFLKTINAPTPDWCLQSGYQ